MKRLCIALTQHVWLAALSGCRNTRRRHTAPVARCAHSRLTQSRAASIHSATDKHGVSNNRTTASTVAATTKRRAALCLYAKRRPRHSLADIHH